MPCPSQRVSYPLYLPLWAPASHRCCVLSSYSVLPHLSSKVFFPDCHRHTDRQTDRQTVACSSIAHAFAECSLQGDWGRGELVTPHGHPFSTLSPSGGLLVCTATYPLGEGGSTGPDVLPQGAVWAREGRGAWAMSGPASRLGLWAGGSETQRGPRGA